MKPYVGSAVVVIPVALCLLFRKKMSSLFDVTVRDSLSPFCREGEKKGEKGQDLYLSIRVKPPVYISDWQKRNV